MKKIGFRIHKYRIFYSVKVEKFIFIFIFASIVIYYLVLEKDNDVISRLKFFR